jgi:DNA polymerase phi
LTLTPAQPEHVNEILTFMPTLRRVLFDVALSACGETASLTTAQIKELLRLALVGIRLTKRASDGTKTISDIWQPSEWEALTERLASTERFKPSTTLRTMCQQIVEASRTPPNSIKSKSVSKASSNKTSAKRKGDRSGIEGESQKTKRKKLKTTKV